MADQLADILNRISANPQGGAAPARSVLPEWAQRLSGTIDSWNAGATRVANSLDEAINAGNPTNVIKNYINDPAKAWADERRTAGQLARVPADIVQGALALPNLPDTVTRLATGGEKGVGRFESLDTIGEKVHDVGKQVGESIAGQPLNNELLSGTPEEKASNWARLFASSAIPMMPGSWQAKMADAAKKVSAGNAVAEAALKTAGTALEVLSPMAVTTKAIPASVIGAGVVAPALEMVVENHIKAQESLKAGQEQSKGALDVAAQGAKEAREADVQRTVQAGMLPSITGNDTVDAIGVGVLGAAVLIGGRYAMAGRALKAQKSADPFGWTHLKKIDQDVAEASDRTLPLWKSVGNVERNQGNTSANVIEMRIKEDTARRSGMSSNVRQEVFMITGELPDSKIKVNPPDNLFAGLGRLEQADPARYQTLIRGMIAQREIDTRNITKQWHDLSDIDSRELGRYVAAMRADPELALYSTQIKQLMNALADYTAEGTRFAKREVKAFKSQNPNFIPTTKVAKDGSQGRWLNPRNITESNRGLKTFEEIGDPIKNIPSYIDEVIRSTEAHKSKRDTLLPLIKAHNRGNSLAKKLIGDTTRTKPPTETEGLYVHWRDVHGESAWTRVNDSFLRRSLHDMANPTALQLYKGLGDIIADAFQKVPIAKQLTWLLRTSSQQQMNVGVPAALSGSPFALTSLKYTAVPSSIMRPPGIASGPFDKFVQDTTQKVLGKRIGLPGAGYLEMPWHILNAVEGVRGVFYQRGAQALKHGIVAPGPISKHLALLGPGAAQEAADAATKRFNKSAAYELKQSGIMGPSTWMSVDPANTRRNVEELLKKNAFGEFGQIILDMLHAIASAPATTALKANKHLLDDPVTKARLMNSIRTMAGDPGSSGLFGAGRGPVGAGVGRAAAHVVNTIPWGNSGLIQPFFKLVDSFRTHPKSVAAGLFTGVIAPTIISTYLTAAQGPEYSDHQFNIRPPDRVASHWYFPIPGMAPDQGAELVVDPGMRMFKLMAEVLAGEMMGIASGILFKPEMAAQYRAVQDMIGKRRGEVAKEMINQSLMPALPNLVTFPAAAFGVPVRDWFGDARPRNEKIQQGFTEGSGPSGASWMDRYAPAWVEDITRALGGLAMSNALKMFDDTMTARFTNDIGRNEENATWKEAWRQGVNQNFKANLRNTMKEATPLFDSYLAISPSKEASAITVQEKLNGLRKFKDAYASATNPGGTPAMRGNNKVGQEPYSGVAPIAAPDILTQQLAQAASQVYQDLSSTHGARIKSLYEDRNSISQSSKFSPDNKRGKMNARAYQIIQQNRALLADLERYESSLSAMFGVDIKFDKLNLNQGQEQFRK